MTQQDNNRAAFEAQIELPPLPQPLCDFLQHVQNKITDYARHAVEQAIAQDRQSRGEPVAVGLHAVYLRDNWDGEGDTYWVIARMIENGKWVADESGKPLLEHEGDAMLRVVPLDSARPPAEPPVKDSLTIAEPAKGPSDEDVLACIKVSLDDAGLETTSEASAYDLLGRTVWLTQGRALLARYQGAQPAASVDHYGVVVCDKGVPNAMQTFIPQRLYRDSNWPDAQFSKVPVYAVTVAAQQNTSKDTDWAQFNRVYDFGYNDGKELAPRKSMSLDTTAQPDSSDEDAYVIDRMGGLLAEIAVIVRGPEPAGHRHGYADLPERVASLKSAVAVLTASEQNNITVSELGGVQLNVNNPEVANKLFALIDQFRAAQPKHKGN